MIYLGTTSFGTEVRMNRLCIGANKLVFIGSVEPHYFAGYTGGRKSFLPGISLRKTIEQNHRFAVKPGARVLKLKGNPVHMDMVEALKTLPNKEIFSIQTVVNAERKIYYATAGNVHSSFYAAIDKAKEVFCVKISKKVDIVVFVASYPMDIDLYQSQKALESGKFALKKGGILLLVSKCRAGIGERTFFDLLASSHTTEEALNRIEKGYKLGYHKVAKIAKLSSRAKIRGFSDLKDEEMKKVFINPFHNLQDAVSDAIKVKGNDSKVIFLMDGSVTIPIT